MADGPGGRAGVGGVDGAGGARGAHDGDRLDADGVAEAAAAAVDDAGREDVGVHAVCGGEVGDGDVGFDGLRGGLLVGCLGGDGVRERREKGGGFTVCIIGIGAFWALWMS